MYKSCILKYIEPLIFLFMICEIDIFIYNDLNSFFTASHFYIFIMYLNRKAH